MTVLKHQALNMRQQQRQLQIDSFQEVLSSLNNKEVLLAIFEDFKLELTIDHPAKELKNYHGNQISKSTKDLILIQKNEVSTTQGEKVNGHDTTVSTIRGSVSSVNDSTFNDSVPGIKVDDLSEVLESEVRESHLKPVSIDQARSLMFLYTKSLNKTFYPTPICIVCDGKDPEHTCLIEASPVFKDSSLAGITVITVTSSGPLHAKTDLLKMDKVIMKTSPTAASQCATCGFAEFEILGKSTLMDISMAPGHNQSYTTVKLECSWDDINTILETPHGAKCTVHIKAVPGSMGSYTTGVYSELCTLVGLAAGATSGEIQWANPPSSSTSSVETLLEELIENVKQGEERRVPVLEGDANRLDFSQNGKDPLSEVDESKVDSPLPQNMIPERDDLDFTERLWMLLNENARGYNDIVSAIKKVLVELQSGQLQPVVHSSNQCTLAKHIRSSYQHNLTVDMKDIEGFGPLRMLIEIGVEKLKRDYLAFFIGQELTTLEKLQWYVSPGDTSNLTLEELVRRLQCLHCVAELYRVGQKSLHLPRKTIWTLVRCGLNYYTNPQSRHDDDHIFSIQVDSANMARFYSSLQPSVWQVEAKHGSTGVDMKRTVYQLSSDKPFPHVSYDDTDHLNGLDLTGIDSDQFILYQTIASSSHIKLF